MTTEGRRAYCQPGSNIRRMRRQEDHKVPGDVYGTISWEEHEEAWRDYAKRYGRDQSAERMNERGGFGYCELCDHLGHPPKTWRPR